MFFLLHQAPSPFAPFQSYILGQKHAVTGFLLLWKQAHEYTPPNPMYRLSAPLFNRAERVKPPLSLLGVCKEAQNSSK